MPKSKPGQRRKAAKATSKTGKSRFGSFPSVPAPRLEEPLGDKDDVVGLQRDVFILVRSPQHLINIHPHPLPVFPLAPENIHPASGGHWSQAPSLGQSLDQGQVLSVFDCPRSPHLTLQVDQIREW